MKKIIEIVEKKLTKIEFGEYQVQIQTDRFEDGLLQQTLSTYFGGVCVATISTTGTPLKPDMLRELADTIEDMRAEASARK